MGTENPGGDESWAFGFKLRFVFVNGKYALGLLINDESGPVKFIGLSNVGLADEIMSGNNEAPELEG